MTGQTPTKYVIFDSNDGRSWTVITQVESPGRAATIKAAASAGIDANEQDAATPVRSWQPVPAVRELVTRVHLVPIAPKPPAIAGHTRLTSPATRSASPAVSSPCAGRERSRRT